MKPTEPGLWAITYTSAAVRLPTRSELDCLVLKARQRNLRESITGVLLYYDGAFLQCIEGPKAGLDRVYASICADPMHHRISELVHEPIPRREFREWSMALCFIGGDLRARRDESLQARLVPCEDTTSASRHLVSAFWANGMGVKCSWAFA